jgi:hypothetical protein
MTQSDATKRTNGPTRHRPPLASRVQRAGSEEVGVVVRSDDYYDTLQLSGVSESAQVLVEWPRGGKTVRLWEEIRNLVSAEEAAK